MDELPIPKPLLDASDAVELARVWVGLGDLHVSLNVGMYGGDEGPGETTAWGDIMADMIRHVAHAIHQQSGGDELRHQQALMKRVQKSLTEDRRTFSGGFEEDE